MGRDSTVYNEMKGVVEDLQRRLTQAMKVEQQLHVAKDLLDRDLSRFRAIQSFNEKAMHATSIGEIIQITVESVVEAFEVECGAFFTYDEERHVLLLADSLGLDGSLQGTRFGMAWLDLPKLLTRRSSSIEAIDPGSHPWGFTGLCQVIYSPYHDLKGALRGIVLGGRTVSKQAFYDEIGEEAIPAFTIFTQQASAILNNFEIKEDLEKTVLERTRNLTVANENLEMEIVQRKQTEEQLRLAEKEAKDLSEFLKKMFGRHLAPEVMNSLLENPGALELGGEKRNVTIMITDLRGFTALAERLSPEQVVTLLNNYYEIMLGVVRQYQGTINDIVGDSILAVFGAPLQLENRALKAVACAIAMQNAMAGVNERNREQGLPGLEMGIGLHDTAVIVGNIGSSTRFKYSVVGSGVILTSRIESYSVGGQILVSEAVRNEVGEALRIDGQREVFPKGSESPIRIYEVGGISGRYNLFLEDSDAGLSTLKQTIPLRCTLLNEKHLGEAKLDAFIVRLSQKGAEIRVNGHVDLYSNMRLNLADVSQELVNRDFYCKVTERSKESADQYIVQFTSLPPEVAAYFLAHRKYAE